MWTRNGRWILPEMSDFHVAFRNLLLAANLRHGTDGFTSPPKEGVLRIFSPLKIRRLRAGLNLRSWVLKASKLPLDHRSRWEGVIKHKMGVSISCTIFAWIISHSNKNSSTRNPTGTMGIDVKYQLSLLQCINHEFSRNIFKKKNTRVSNFTKIRPVGASSFKRMDGQTSRRTGKQKKKLIIAVRSFANAPSNGYLCPPRSASICLMRQQFISFVWHIQRSLHRISLTQWM